MLTLFCVIVLGFGLVAPSQARGSDLPPGLIDEAAPVMVEAMPPDKYASIPSFHNNTESASAPEVRAAPMRLDDMFFSDVPVVLSAKEQYAVDMVQPWQNQTEIGVNPIAAPGGAVQFAHGLERPSVVCAVMQVTDIELQAGEVIRSINIGDSVRWIVDTMMSGPDIPHLTIKPMDVGLTTSLIVATDRRTYRMRLRSTREDYMAWVNFTYPTDAAAAVEKMRIEAEAKRREEVERDTIPATHEYLGNLDFNYIVTGQANWKPTRVYNDGVKTIIEMPYTLTQDDAPILMGLRRRKGFLKTIEEDVLVNYRTSGNRYIADAVLDTAKLVVGVGKGQTRVTIERGKKEGAR